MAPVSKQKNSEHKSEKSSAQDQKATGRGRSLVSGSRLNQLVEFASTRGLAYPSSEPYGGLAASYDFGPTGVPIVQAIKDLWRSRVVARNPNVIEQDAALLGRNEVWEASGHVAKFNDPLVEDLVTHRRFRADHLVEDALGIDASDLSVAQLQNLITQNNLQSPEGNPITEVKTFSLMVEAMMGTTADDKQGVFLRPETCQAIFVNFNHIRNSRNMQIPFGVLQTGKAFRNEVTARRFVLRTREFDQMEFEFFFDPEDKSCDWYAHWGDYFKDMLEKDLQIPADRIRLRELGENERPHYARRSADFEIQLSDGNWLEVSPLNDRSDWDLSQHQKHSGKNFQVQDPRNPARKFTPHVIETSFGVARLFYIMMDLGLVEEKLEKDGSATTDSRIVFKIPPRLAPTQVAVLPLMKKDGMPEFAQEIFQTLCDEFRTDLDERGQIGKRYRRHDERGTPFCVTIDHQSLEDHTVTLRDRDTMKQRRLNVSELQDVLRTESQ